MTQPQPSRLHPSAEARSLLSSHPVLGLTPLERPDPRLVTALGRAGCIGILDLGRDAAIARRALAQVAREGTAPFGVRIPEQARWAAHELPALAAIVVVSAGASFEAYRPRVVLVQVTTLDEARAAADAGADGLIVKGNEAGGRVGSETSFVLLQHLAATLDLPLWVQGGIGLHTAAAAIAGGATGVVLDSQLALVRESSLAEPVKAALRAMDGSETTVLGDHRVFTRPDLPVARRRAPNEAELAGFLALLGGDDLEENLLPVGQDAAFARPLADRFRTASGVVHAVRTAIHEHLREARALEPLAPESPLAVDHGIRYPIAQGPMTRVSDRAAFADAVSRGGGLPFLALALMRGAEIRTLLEETQALLGDRAWGVGILGFVPEEVREEQLAVVRDFAPMAAIIAGGRPSQARPLEAQGTITYLHVPSPGLLDLFLNDGARRFIFEGRECGGHVGPRTSFVLWELQIERLLAFAATRGDAPAGSLADVSVLFAGGVHDGRSAAMVAAMAAPLAAHGAHVGVLMGTAYLFTEEAVSSGAIQPTFQDAAIQCETTVLLETAPGHATRCVETDYVRAFQEEKRALEADGKGAEEVWASLEQLNLGRLRIAAKGVRREGAGLAHVDGATQRREGMFMIGQIAALRASVSTIADLHWQVCAGATAELAARAAATELQAELPAPADVAVIGIACIFPDAPDRHAYWANINSGRSSITEVPKERWDAAIYFDPEAPAGEKSASRWGGFVPTMAFDPLAYGIPPRSLSAIEPVQLLALEVARRALDDAGYAERPFDREHTAVIFGAEAGTDLSSAYGFRAMYPQYAGPIPPALDEHLPTLTEDSFPGVLANVIAGRIANRLDLGGSNYTVDAACASSLAAIDLAVKELRAGSANLVLCGGADLHNSINDYLLFSSVHALSPTGACRTFDASADGIVLGEGVACVVLKRLADAERDGDRIYAVIKGIAGSSDGRSLGLTAPRKEGQVRALERAYRVSGVSPAEVGLVEAHGTGTVVGDRTELGTLTDVYLKAGAAPGSAALGSVKSQIGHTKCAAGLAGLIKATLALHHRVLPPTLMIRKPNPAWDAATSPFSFSDRARPWSAESRRASVSAFGFGGANFHAVLAAYDAADPPVSGLERWPAELFLFRGVDRAAALVKLDRLERVLTDAAIEAESRGVAPFTLADLSRSVSSLRRRADGPVQLAIVASGLADLREKVRRARGFANEARAIFVPAGREPGKLAFLFPGQGSQRTGMLADLFVAFPALQRFLALGARWSARIFPPSALDPEMRATQNAALTDTRVAQPALGIAAMALGDLLRSLGLRPDMVAGHSYGELAALCFAGAIAEADLLGLSETRAECILASTGADPGTMAAVTAAPAAVAPLIEGLARVVIANHNAPDQTVISGPTAGIQEALAALEAEGLSARSIPVACAFHSPLVARAPALFAERLAGIAVSSPTIPVYSNATASTYSTEPAEIRRTLADHLALPVRFTEEIEAMYAAGARTFVEVGPGRVLSGLTAKILGARPHTVVACDHSGEPGIERLLIALAELAVAGVPVDPSALFAGREARVLDLATIPTAPRSTSLWLVNGHLARPATGEIPKGALRPVTEPLVQTTQALAPTGEREAAVMEFLRTTREVIEAQRQVMLGFLGSPPDTLPASEPAPLASAPPSRRASVPPPSLRGTIPPRSQRGTPPPSRAGRAEIAGAPRPPSSEPGIPAPAVSLVPVSMKDALLDIVSERTGYPVEMLDLDLNLEADLSIDSIKRIEILGTLGQAMGWAPGSGDGRDKMIEKLATQKTLRGILGWLDANPGGSAPSGEGAPTLATLPPNETTADPPRSSVRPQRGVRRYVLAIEDAPALPIAEITGRTWLIVPDRAGVAAALVALLEARGGSARLLGPGDPLTRADGLIDLGAFAATTAREGAAAVRALFERLKRAGDLGLGVVLAVGSLGAPFGAEGALPRSGVAGLLKTFARELPGITARAVALSPSEPAERLAEHLLAELRSRDLHVEVAVIDGARKALVPVAADRVRNGEGGGLVLGPDAVVVVTGGARGITASAAIALAKRFGCKLELIGRSPLPAGDEDPELATARDLPALRKAILTRGLATTPAAVEALCAKLLAARALRSTLAAIAAAGATARYHSIDVRDPTAFGAVIDAIYAHHGRIDGVIHGAGVLEDKLLAQKTRESFDRVFDTKVESAITLTEKLRPDVGFVVFFASISGAFGNRGQIDYAAANDSLDKLACWLQARVSGRVLSIDWGPWAGAGMVSPELAREYERRGMGLIDPAEGLDAFLDELLHGGSTTQVILMNGSPLALSAPVLVEVPPVTSPSPLTSPSPVMADA